MRPSPSSPGSAHLYQIREKTQSRLTPSSGVFECHLSAACALLDGRLRGRILSRYLLYWHPALCSHVQPEFSASNIPHGLPHSALDHTINIIRHIKRSPNPFRYSELQIHTNLQQRSVNVPHQGASLEQLAPGIQIDADLPYHTVQTERPYTALTYDAETHHIVAASTLRRDWMVYDDEAKPIWTPEGIRAYPPIILAL